MFQIFDLKMTFLDLKMIFLTPKMTSSDLDMHIIRIKFRIDSYAFEMHLAIFSIFDPTMTFVDP